MDTANPSPPPGSMDRSPGLDDNRGLPPQLNFPLQNSYTNEQGGPWSSPDNSRGLPNEYQQSTPGSYYHQSPTYFNPHNYPTPPSTRPGPQEGYCPTNTPQYGTRGFNIGHQQAAPPAEDRLPNESLPALPPTSQADLMASSLGCGPPAPPPPAPPGPSAASSISHPSNKRKPRRTPDQIRMAEAALAQKKIQKASEKAAVARKKEATKAARDMLKKAEADRIAASRFVWSEEASLELLGFVKMIRDEFDELAKRPGFTPFGKYFLANDHRKSDFPLLVAIDNDCLLRRYHALMRTWKQVKDYSDTSGNGGLFPALLEFGLAHRLWDALTNMNGDNRAANAEGECDIHETLGSLMAPPGTGSTDSSDESDDIPGASPPEVDTGRRYLDSVSKSIRGRPPPSILTAEEMALDDEADDEDESDLPEGTLPDPSPDLSADSTAPPSASGALAPLPGPQTTPLAGRRLGTKTPTRPTVAKVAGQPSRPPTSSGNLPRRRGKTEDAPKKEDPMAQGMFMMMHKASEEAIEDRKIRELARLDDRRDTEARLEQARIQAQLDREMMAQRAREAELRADQRDEDRKEERREAMQQRLDEARRYEATQAAQEKSRQLFETAMLTLLSNMGKGSS